MTTYSGGNNVYTAQGSAPAPAVAATAGEPVFDEKVRTRPHDVLLKIHPRSTWNNPVLWVSVIVSAFLLLCSLFWYIEAVGTNFVHQWALMLTAFIGGAIGIAVLTFLIPFHLRYAYQVDIKAGHDGFPYSPWHRWTLWMHYVLIIVTVAVQTISIWSWLHRNDIELNSTRYNPTVAPASPTSIQYNQAALAATLPSGLLFFVTLYAIVRHVHAEAGDVKTVSYTAGKSGTPGGGDSDVASYD